MGASEPITVSRACEVIEIPSGIRATLPAGAVVRILQHLGSGFTVATDHGYMYRVDAKDTDALGLSSAATAQELAVREGAFSEQMVWDQLKTVYDPEIPADIYELGLIYKIDIADDRSVKIDMSLTSPNCPSAQELPIMVENAVTSVAGVRDAKVEVVWDPPWDPSRMSDEARLVLNMW